MQLGLKTALRRFFAHGGRARSKEVLRFGSCLRRIEEGRPGLGSFRTGSSLEVFTASTSFASSSSSGFRASGLGSGRGARAFSSLTAEAVDEDFEEMDPSLVYVHNAECVPYPHESAKDFLVQGKRGAYTGARSVDSSAVFEFEAHVERLAKSAALMLESEREEKGRLENLGRFEDFLSSDSLRPKVAESMGAGMSRFKECNGGDVEMKITLLLTWEPSDEGGDFDIFTLVTPLGDRPAQPVKVQIGGKPRKNALAKDSEWARQRRALELAMPEDCNEVILKDDEGRLFEGLQTNFYVVKDNKVQTAGEGILEGTVRKLLLEECEKESIDVDARPPSVQEMESWQGCFISSTSRLLLPVSEIVYTTEDGVAKSKSFTPLDPLVLSLEKLILDRYREESTTILV
ncbi:class IV aminotransferase [Chloropicon primus]|uniref:Class IV aminotransferase n=2 Tax=Chloropicon primus TaxID=1764295 RepID=A0A5B8MHZ8_9CHLO|nr:class IV aminotransferase [Chloropicon primus]UPQ99308.1 class IV aminotransferase [Chloropicon primus]|eukprot:QDZ20096.1 class IV aminotransferase [Chloropicon primus]